MKGTIHSDRTTKYYDPDFGFCVCGNCEQLPHHAQQTWYRYEETHYAEFGESRGEGSTVVRLLEFRVAKETPKGVWLSFWSGGSKDRFVLRDARKRYACPTKEEARTSFIARKNKEIRIHEARIRAARRALAALEEVE